MAIFGPELFENRELSWLAFNDRVLAQARDPRLPVYERLKFFGIAASNLDEFFMVRVAGLKQQVQSGVVDTQADGMLAEEQLVAIGAHVRRFMKDFDDTWKTQLRPAFHAVGVELLSAADLGDAQGRVAREVFTRDIFPTLTPIAIDPGHPFPHLRSKTLNIALKLQKDAKTSRRNLADSLYAVVQVPQMLPRLLRVPSENGGRAFVFIESLIAAYAFELFPGYQTLEATAFRAVRNWDLDVDEEESEDLLSAVQAELRRRDRGAAVRLELQTEASAELESVLRDALHLGSADVFRLQSPLSPTDLGILAEQDGRRELHVDAFVPALPASVRDPETMFDAIRAGDILLHHPYESFDPVVRFIDEAADDPRVLAIKQTFYRTGGDSPFVRALSRAAENGKQVACLVEIKARFDEANNIAWARRLEESGVHVVYGLIGLKTHAKAALVVRREDGGIKRYVHLATGNYNPQTARQYTDLSFLTSRTAIADDVSGLFNMLTGLGDAPRFKKLAVAPMTLESSIVRLIRRETKKAKAGGRGVVLAKMNSLVDPDVITSLYRASQAGVDVRLQVRGICCLRPGVPGVSENIRVTSVVDRFLEHARVFAFGEGEEREVYIASADWMPRNFSRRVEVMVPIEEPALATRLVDEVLGIGLADNQAASRLLPDGRYLPVEGNGTVVRSQAAFLELAKKMDALAAKEVAGRASRGRVLPAPS